jgi:hypothetical protein
MSLGGLYWFFRYSSAGLYGSGRESATGPIVTKFWGGSCATLGGGQGTVTVVSIEPF